MRAVLPKNMNLMKKLRAVMLAGMICFGAGTAHAQCVNPAGSAGEMVYNGDHSVAQYCDGSGWVAMGPPPRLTGQGLPIDSSLVGLWKLDETSGTAVNDYAGNHNGTMQNGLTGSNTAEGVIGTSIIFDGNDDYISAPDDDALDLTSYTISAWLYPNDADDAHPIMQKTNVGSPPLNYYFVYDGSADTLSCGFYDGSSWQEYEPTVLIAANTWTHLTCTYDDPSNEISVYANGQLVGSTTLSGSPVANADMLYIGRSMGGTLYTVDGRLDDVHLYNRSLTPEEVARCCSQKVVSDGLVGHWPLDETSGTYAYGAAGLNGGDMIGGLNASTDSVPGRVGTAFQFDGASDRIDVDVPIDVSGDQLTLSAWVKIDGFTDPDPRIVVKDFTNWSLDTEDTTSEYKFRILGTEITGGSIETGQWAHVAGVYDGSTMILYQDGVSVASTSRSGNLIVDGTGIHIGDEGAGNRNLDGAIDDVRIYNRALSASEVAELYASAEGRVRYNERYRATEFFNGNQWMSMGPEQYVPDAAQFDDSTAYLSGAVSGLSDSKFLTASFWYNRDTIGGIADVVYNANFPDNYISFESGELIFHFRDTGASPRLEARSSIASIDDTTGWHHVVISVDLDDTNKRHFYIDGVDASPTWTTYSSAADMNFGNGTKYIGAWKTDDYHFGGSLADFWFAPGVYIDLSDPSNLERFINNAGSPVYLGADGSLPTGTAPAIFLSGDVSDWHTNKGTAGGFTENGTLTTGFGPAAAITNVTDGLVGWWRLDETSGGTISDSMNSLDGTWVDNEGDNDVTQETISAIAGTGLNFDNVNDIISIPNDSSLENFTELTLAAWVYPTGVGLSAGSRIISKADGGTGDNYQIGMGNGGYDAWFRLETDGDVQTNLEEFGALTQNEWNFIVGKWDGTNMRLYINAAEVASSPVAKSGVLDADGDPLTIGGHSNGPTGRNFPGGIDDARVYNRALTDAEILQLYNWGLTGGLACLNPVGNPGAMVYNTTGNVMQFCNGDEWVGVGK